jgi:hypothetical protein
MLQRGNARHGDLTGGGAERGRAARRHGVVGQRGGSMASDGGGGVVGIRPALSGRPLRRGRATPWQLGGE